MEKTKIGIIGSGNIGTDLLVKIMRSPYLICSAFVGRNNDSLGLAKAKSLGVKTSIESLSFFEKNPKCCEIIFDATSAQMHLKHAPIFKKLNLRVIDLTPAKIGKMSVFAVNGRDCLDAENVNMVTCGGQASIPIAYALSTIQKDIEYLEVVSSIASNSAGPATRQNLDEYIETTQSALTNFTGVQKTKAILNLNPALPCIDMQTTVFAKVSEPKMKEIIQEVQKMTRHMQKYVPGYRLLMDPVYENGRIVVMVKVKGLGDYLPRYAGNLDIINCSAIAMAELWAKNKLVSEIA